MSELTVQDIVNEYATRLFDDLQWCAPEMVKTHIQRRMEELIGGLRDEADDV